MSGDNELEVYRQHRSNQKQHTYFLLAAVGACIGFALTQTKDASLQINQIPLAIALVSWGLSFYCGCVQADRDGAALYANLGLIRLQKGRDPIAGRNPELMQYGSDTIREIIEQHGEKSASASRWQFRFLAVGVVFYIGWHVLDMWART
ncbi:hypothetical protein [Achromobacter xylosoxidans]|uniref:hypothetical protein n=1 Tax=Alcaligenes xylosoxydans xylosoxydans TaxID=85698 RepID=UPI0010414B7C|nr:hypothetical protein [Achromobacter xylosoxidans]